MYKFIKLIANRNVIVLATMLFIAGAASAQVQTVTGSLSVTELSAGQSTDLTVSYTATDADGLATLAQGIGLKLYFDSSVVSLGEYRERLFEGSQPFQIKNDISDGDGDPKTDKFWLTPWANTGSGAGWPADENTSEALSQPLNLYIVPLTAISGFNGSTLNFTASGSAGYTFSGDSVTISKIPGTVSTLSNLTATHATTTDIPLTPTFESAVTSYSASVAYPVSSVALVPVLTDGFAAISEYTANGDAVTGNEVSLAVGSNEVSITVLAEDATGTTSYSVTMTRAETLAVAISSAPILTSLNSSAYGVSGTCNVSGVSVTVTVASGAASTSAATISCTDSVWSASGIDASALSEGVITVTAIGTTDLETATATTATSKDISGPAISAPASITIAAIDADGVPASNATIVSFLQEATGTDATDGTVTVSNDAISAFPIAITTVTFSATDSLGNTSTATSTVTVEDQTAPVINAPATFVVLGDESGLAASSAAIVDFLAGVTGTDNVDGDVAVDNDAPTETFLFGATTVTFIAVDAVGNQATVTTVVNVSLDPVAPELTIADSISINVDMPYSVVTSNNTAIVDFLAAAVATDNKDDDSTLVITNDGLDEYPVGDTVVTFSVSDVAGNITTASATIAIIILDTDGDGLPDFYETANGLDPDDASDASADFDGDGISNLDEYTNGSDPTKDELPPELTIPANISMAATGRMTDVPLGDASATDNKDGAISPTPSATGPFKSGLYKITWSISDAAGNSSSAVQTVEIAPLANLRPSSITVEGATVEINVELSGVPVAYPVTIPMSLGGTASAGDFTASADSIVITAGTSGMATLSITSDDEAESEETVVITLGTPTNAALGSVIERTVTILEENVAPTLSLVVTQNGTAGRIVAAGGGLVTVSASYSDVNPGDRHTFEWATAVSDMPSAVIDGAVATFDPSTLGDTIVSAGASVTDSGSTLLTTSDEASIKVLATAPVLGDTDTDGDGVSDSAEGYGDSDNDGISDYQDNIIETYLAPTSNGMVMQSPVGTNISLGDTALLAGNNGVSISEEAVGVVETDYDYLGGLFDFEVSGAQIGASYNIVLPLETAVPKGAALKKYMGEVTGWQEFVVNASNAISSATAASGACPESGSASYVDGLTVGATCLQLQIEDGGANDADGVADGTVTDPSGIATLYFGPPSSDSTISINVTEITGGGSETAEITVTAVDSDGRNLEGMSITATSSLSNSTVGSFADAGEGVYTATLRPGNRAGNLTVTATINDGTDSMSITSSAVTVSVVTVKKSGGGGCTVGEGQSDLSLILLMLAALLLMAKRRFIKI